MYDIGKKVGDAVARHTPAGPTAAVFLAAKDGKVIFREAYGMADTENRIPAAPADNFNIASNTKQFTCLALLMLRDRGLLSLEDTMDRFFPDYPDYAKTVTVRQLMNHMSGMPEYFDNDNKPLADFTGKTTLAELVEIIKGIDDKTAFEPGTKFEYCNAAYCLLGDIVRQLSGKMLGDFFETEIFKPLGMDRTYAPDYCDEIVPDMAKGYGTDEKTGKAVEVPYDMELIGYGDGCIFSNVDDLLTWHNYLYGFRQGEDPGIIDRAHLEELYTKGVYKDGTTSNYGFGIIDGTVDEEIKAVFPDKRELWHSGGTTGYLTRASYFPDDKVSLIMLTNWCEKEDGTDFDGLFSDYAQIVFDALEKE